MDKLWAGRTNGATNSLADDFNSSIHFDCRLYHEDITGSMAHAAMLAERGIISQQDADDLIYGLQDIMSDLDSGALEFDPRAEDIHMFVEQTLTERLGEVGKKLHTARSRNDQIALDLRLHLRHQSDDISACVREMLTAILTVAEKNKTVVMPGYTHMQRAQPILFSHHILAYAMMLLRDLARLRDCRGRIDVSPIGACALAGTTYDTDRQLESKMLGFSDIARNSIDAVSDRDFCVELLAALSLLMMHLSRLSEELLLWTSWEFHFVTLSDAFTTGSSIMPQKKNSDMAELVRGKTGRVYGDLVTLLTMLKGLPLAYDKDMQEDKEAVFDALDTVKKCLHVMAPMLGSMTVHADTMYRAAQTGFINATDLADYLVRKGLPFRTAYKLSGQLVSECIQSGHVLETLPLETYRRYSDLIEDDVYHAIDLQTCVKTRISEGGTSPDSVEKQIAFVKEQMAEFSDNGY